LVEAPHGSTTLEVHGPLARARFSTPLTSLKASSKDSGGSSTSCLASAALVLARDRGSGAGASWGLPHHSMAGAETPFTSLRRRAISPLTTPRSLSTLPSSVRVVTL